MAKTSAPLMGFGASGTLAGTLVYAKWRGVPYARQHVIPANPQSVAQTETRDIFRTMSQAWKQAPAALVAPWDAFATGRPFLGVNQFMGQNLRAFRKPTTQTDMALFIASPGARGGPAPGVIDLDADNVSIDATLDTPTPPDGWAIVGVRGVAFPDQDPTLDFVGPFTFAQNNVAPYALAFTGLTASTDYVVAAWIEYTRPDGKTAYSISVGDTISTTA